MEHRFRKQIPLFLANGIAHCVCLWSKQKTSLKAWAKLFRFRTGYFSTAISLSVEGWYRNCGIGPAPKRGQIVHSTDSVLFAGLAHIQKFVCETKNNLT